MHRIFTIGICIDKILNYLMPKSQEEDWISPYYLSQVNKYFFKLVNNRPEINKLIEKHNDTSSIYNFYGEKEDVYAEDLEKYKLPYLCAFWDVNILQKTNVLPIFQGLIREYLQTKLIPDLSAFMEKIIVISNYIIYNPEKDCIIDPLYKIEQFTYKIDNVKYNGDYETSNFIVFSVGNFKFGFYYDILQTPNDRYTTFRIKCIYQGSEYTFFEINSPKDASRVKPMEKEDINTILHAMGMIDDSEIIHNDIYAAMVAILIAIIEDGNFIEMVQWHRLFSNSYYAFNDTLVSGKYHIRLQYMRKHLVNLKI